MTPVSKKSFTRRIFPIIILLLSALSANIAAQTDEIAKQPPQDANLLVAKRLPLEKVKLISFTLNTGQRIGGKVESEDAFEIEISEIKDSKILLSKYFKNDIDKKTLSYKTVSELDYWRDTGKYFLQRVWDFNNDPDEFMQAIRCFENAKALTEKAVGPEHKLVAELDDKINQIKTDMAKWTELAKSREEMKKLELLSTLDSRLQQIQGQIAANTKDITGIRLELATATAAMGNYSQLNNKINNTESTARSLDQRMIKVESDLENLWRWYKYNPRYYMQPRNRPEPNSTP